MNAGSALSAAKSLYASGAHAAGTALTRFGLLPDEPPHRDRRLQHWLYSLTRVHDSLAMAELDVPWWTYRAVDAVDSWLAGHGEGTRVFEFGSGASSLWLSRRTSSVTTVEHHRGFAEMMRPAFDMAGNIDLHVVEPASSAHPAVPSQKEGHEGLDFSAYLHTIDEVGGVFDLIVIDGRAREACLVAALAHLAPDGLIVFDNSKRARYRRAIAAADVSERRLPGLTPTLPYPDQTSLIVPAR